MVDVVIVCVSCFLASDLLLVFIFSMTTVIVHWIIKGIQLNFTQTLNWNLRASKLPLDAVV